MSSDEQAEERGWYWTREHALVIVLVVLTAIFLVLCAFLAHPFVNSLAWAIALAVVAHPIHAWVARKISNKDVAAGLSVLLVAILIVAPASFVLHQVGKEMSRVTEVVRSGELTNKAKEALQRYPQLEAARAWAEPQLAQTTEKGLGAAGSLVSGSLNAILDLLLTFFFLYFLFRDRAEALRALRLLVPLDHREADEVFTRVAETIHATIYGTLVVAAVQGALGGLMFWWLGLPAPLLWGVVMGLLAIVPVLGAFVVWVPGAIALGLMGSWGKALILTVWGTVVIGMADNLLYPALVGKRLRMHTAPVFIAIVGGLALFGAAGLVLGPVILAVTHALIDVWRRRTRHGPAEAAVQA